MKIFQISFFIISFSIASVGFSQVGPMGPGSMGAQQGFVPPGMAPVPMYNAGMMPGGGNFGAARGVGELPPQAMAQNSVSQGAMSAGCVVDRNGNTRLVNQGGAATPMVPTPGH